MLRDSASAQPDLPPSQHRRGSSYQSLRQDHGRRQHEHDSSIGYHPLGSPTATPPRRENAFVAPRPALLPYQEYHSGFTDDDQLGTSPVTTPSFGHRRQTSFSALLPLAIRNRTPSPTRKASVVPITEEEMPYTGDSRGRPSPSRPGTAASESSPRGGFAGWLSGTAAGNALDSLSRPDLSPSRDSNTLTPTKLRKAQTFSSEASETPIDAVSRRASRFMSALSVRLAPPPPLPSSVADDELYNLPIESALFPSGSPTDRDAFSPAAFKNLHTNAVGLLSKFQAAYRARVNALRDLEAERAAQRDELEEAVTRATHLKMQLEGMAHRAAEQEKAMRQMMDELMAERQGREEERLAYRQRAAVAESLASEDLEVEDWRGGRQRKSGGSSGESWAETEMTTTTEESGDVDSVWSRSRSPMRSMLEDVLPQLPVVTSGTGTVRVKGVQALQKIFKGIAEEMVGETTDRCRNCEGRDASVAWETVGMLRDENRYLKQRVGQLEVAVEGALDLVNGLGL